MRATWAARSHNRRSDNGRSGNRRGHDRRRRDSADSLQGACRRPPRAVGLLRRTRSDGDDRCLVDNRAWNSHGSGTEGSGGNGNGRETHFDCLCCEKNGIIP